MDQQTQGALPPAHLIRGLQQYEKQAGQPFDAHRLPVNHLPLPQIEMVVNRIAKMTFVHPGDGESYPIPWLVPEEGCYQKAHFLAEQLELQGIRAMAIVVEKGRRGPGPWIESDHAYRPQRTVQWGMHVATLIRMADSRAFVVDFLLSPTPIPFFEWLRSVNAHHFPEEEVGAILRHKVAGRRGDSIPHSALYVHPFPRSEQGPQGFAETFARLLPKVTAREFTARLLRWRRGQAQDEALLQNLLDNAGSDQRQALGRHWDLELRWLLGRVRSGSLKQRLLDILNGNEPRRED